MEDGILDQGVTEVPVETFEVPNDEVKVNKETETATEVSNKNSRRRKKKNRKENGVKRSQTRDR